MMKTSNFIRFAAFAACFVALGAIAQSNEMYQYTDENGTVVFTDKKPANVDVQKKAIPPGPPPQGDNPYAELTQEAESPDTPSAAQQRRDEIAAKSKQSREAKAKLETDCAAWQAEVDTLEPHRRQFYTDEKGETVRMDDVERANRVAELKEKIAANCN